MTCHCMVRCTDEKLFVSINIICSVKSQVSSSSALINNRSSAVHNGDPKVVCFVGDAISLQ